MHIIIQSLCSILCWYTFGSRYSLRLFESEATSWAHVFIRLDGKCTDLSRSLDSGWAIQGHSLRCPQDISLISWLCIYPVVLLKDEPSALSRFSSRMSTFIFSSIMTSLPLPATEKHPHSMMLSPPCFTVGLVIGLAMSGACFLQTPRVQFMAHEIREFCFSWSESLRCLLADSRLAAMCFFFFC